MTPRFAKAVDPILLYVLELLDRISAEENPMPQEERIRVRSLIDQGEAAIGSGEQWELAKYALISWIDQMLVDSTWASANWWRNNVMEVEMFSTRLCFEQFFVKAQQAAALPNRDALEVYYVCVVLGFRGLYADPNASSMMTQKHGLPPDLATWAKHASMSIQLGQGRPTLDPPGRELFGAPPLRKKSRVVWPWLVASMLLITNVICYAWSRG